MPLVQSASREAVSENIRRERDAGKGQSQAVAIALNVQRHNRAFGGGIGHVHIDPPAKIASAKPPMSPSQGTPWWTRSAEKGIAQAGHGIGHFAEGGGMSASQGSPWWERQDSRDMIHPDIPFTGGGFIHSGVAGRTDRIPMVVGAESHVLPADTVSGAGQGNSLAGANIIQQALKTGPWGTDLPKAVHGHGPPSAPHPAALGQDPYSGLADGGQTKHGITQVLVAGGEIAITSDVVEDLGRRGIAMGKGKQGETPIECGHRLLDEMIHRIRQFNIQWLRHAPPPKK